ncbi:hypothetical protein [Corynebacterium sp.]|uniref:hypothetical protein n=1 Tax=Corynebacterium sp. TaxID=1720 RepID=UPI0026DAEB0D|nr:hypothetical protein [Corynebacterium sp.]MDO5033185.1 hypothetical protein [Corynebacterium sp.]
MRVRRPLLLAWCLLLVASVCWPFLLPGEFLWRDMAVPARLGWTPTNFGGGDLPARNAPQDGALALFSQVLPATWLLRVLVLGAAGSAAWAAWRLSSRTPALAIALAVANPFIIERLLQGQWSLAVAAWLLPVIVAAPNRRVRWLAMAGASLTPTGALLGLAVALCAPGPHRRLLADVPFGLALCLPWLIPGLLSPAAPTSAAAGVAAFAPRAETGLGTVGSLLTLGGIWNAEATTALRHAGFALFGLLPLLLIADGARRVPRRLAVLAALGLGGAIVAWLLPQGLASAIEAIPGLGILRDSHKFVALAIPAYVIALGNLRLPRALAAAALACVCLQVADAPVALSVLRPGPPASDSTLVAQLGGREVFFADRSSLVTVPGGVAVDPYTKTTAALQSGELRVDGVIVDYPAPRWVAARAAWQARDMHSLEELGVGAVVEGEKIVATTDAPAPPVPWALSALWCLLPVLAFIPAPVLWRRRSG